MLAEEYWKSLAMQQNDKLDSVVISLTSSKSFCISDKYWKRSYLQTDSSLKKPTKSATSKI
jgi:hypothetical protein